MKNVVRFLFVTVLLSGAVSALAVSKTEVASLRAGDGSPMPICSPGKPCGNDNLQLRAGDGSPMPICSPGKPCGNDNLRAGLDNDLSLVL